ncbi:MAG: histidinol dehydrogenase [Calditrichia bacterium]
MRIIKYPNQKSFAEISARPEFDRSELEKTVTTILQTVKEDGDTALKRYSKQFDLVDIENFLVTEKEFEFAVNSVSTDLKDAIKTAQKNIEKFHACQVQPEQIVETSPGVRCWRKSTPIDKVGLYIPGGSAPLFSSLLMLGVPARLAGCEEIAVCTPPTKNGSVDTTILYTAHELGIKQVFKTGGAQAIAAMAFGTETIPNVYKIFGPGNQFVTMAKQLVQLEGIAIDLPAGPSEVAIIADQNANPAFIAADLLSQAEHGPDSQVLLITTEEVLIDQVQDNLQKQLETLPRRNLAEQSLAHSRLVLVEDLKAAIDLVNIYAPEHLILLVADPHAFSSQVKNAGSVFLGPFTPESAGDYASGTNHTLPTNRYARMYSGVSLDSFLTNITFQEISAEGLQQLGPIVQKMAETEKLTGHSLSIEVRLNQIKKYEKND